MNNFEKYGFLDEDEYYEWRREIKLFKLCNKFKSPTIKWIKENMTDDPNYNNWLKNSTEYVVDHIFPKHAFLKFYLMYNNLNFNELNKIANLRINLRIITRHENNKKGSKFVIKDVTEYIINNGIKLK
jgi:hypothetical protein